MEISVVLLVSPGLPLARFILGPGLKGLIPLPAVIRLLALIVELGISAPSFEVAESSDGTGVVLPLGLE